MSASSLSTHFLNPSVALDILHHCDRTTSQEARYALEKLVWKPLRAHSLLEALSPSCPIHSHNDILRIQESLKLSMGPSTWKCVECGKFFSTEHYLDIHISRYHSDLYDRNSTTVCLSDLCGTIIPCIPTKSTVRKPPISTYLFRQNGTVVDHFDLPSFCNRNQHNHQKEKNKRIQYCSHVLNDCFLSSYQQSPSVKKHLSRLKVELCEKASQVACIPRHNIHKLLGKPETILQTEASFPFFYLFICFFTLFSLLILLYCFCPHDVHVIDRFTTSNRRLMKRKRRRRKQARYQH